MLNAANDPVRSFHESETSQVVHFHSNMEQLEHTKTHE